MSYETYELIHATGRVLRTGLIALLGFVIMCISMSGDISILSFCGLMVGIVWLFVGLILFSGDMINWFNYYSCWIDYEDKQRKLRWDNRVEKKLEENE